ncbi:hypothetical protein [Winogradskyella sp. 3972H.M.0a.05]|uniref:hypothetical protein n=1 Tax=Winogradskyella sp. 3972H.M.0a.05 TaxID=2950277 RepID=UPI003394C8C6
MASYYSFSEEAVANALEAARKTHEGTELRATEAGFNIHRGGDLLVAAECISITVEDHKVCINLPLHLGKHCISIPISVPNGTAGKACLSICTTWGFPTGVKVSVVIAGITVVSQTFGKC